MSPYDPFHIYQDEKSYEPSVENGICREEERADEEAYSYSYTFAPVFEPEPDAPLSTACKKKNKMALLMTGMFIVGILLGGGGYLLVDQLKSPLADPPAQISSKEDEADSFLPPKDITSGNAAITPTNIVFANGDLALPELFEKANPAVVAISTESTAYNAFGQPASRASAGSGFIIQSNGVVVTNQHVIDGASSIQVILHDGTTYNATLLGEDKTTDLAVLKIQADNLPCLSWGDSAALKVGEAVAAIGNPLGELANTLTDGIISALNRTINIDGTPRNMLQTNAAISPGNSGGPLLNMKCEVIAVNSAKQTGNGVEGLGFAIPSSIARTVVEELIDHGYVSGRPKIGISVETVTRQTAAYTRLPLGVYVTRVENGSAAQKAGLQPGDVIVKINDAAIASADDLLNVRTQYKAGDTVSVTLVRDGQETVVSLTFDEEKPTTSAIIQTSSAWYDIGTVA